MREILFRGKRVDGKGWVEGYLFQVGGTCFILLSTDRAFDYPEKVLVHPETVGQFTGLLDKNGKKIFEGDVVSMDYAPTYIKRNRVVKWRSCGFYTFRNAPDPVTFELLPLQIGNDCDAEIIGNIHDNPETI